MIEKRLGLHISGDDVYLNVAGGLTLREPAMDLAIVAAIVSSYKDRAIDHNTIALGEIGLSGEMRQVRKLKRRLTEAAKLGYRRAVIPVTDRIGVTGLQMNEAAGIEEAVEALGL